MLSQQILTGLFLILSLVSTVVGKDLESFKNELGGSVNNILRALNSKTESLFIVELNNILNMREEMSEIRVKYPTEDVKFVVDVTLEKSQDLLNGYPAYPFLNPRYTYDRDQYTLRNYIAPTIMFFQLLKKRIEAIEIPDSEKPIEMGPNGLSYKDITIGKGKSIKYGDNITLSYKGWTRNGDKFLDTDGVVEDSTKMFSAFRVGGLFGGHRILEVEDTSAVPTVQKHQGAVGGRIVGWDVFPFILGKDPRPSSEEFNAAWLDTCLIGLKLGGIRRLLMSEEWTIEVKLIGVK